MAEKLYYSMGEVAEMLDVSQPLLRFWESKFDIVAPRKNKKGNRMFSPDDVRNLKTIYHLVKERGMTLAGAAKYIKASRGTIERDMEIAERLGTIRALLLEVRGELGGGGIVTDDTLPEEEMEAAEEVAVAEEFVAEEVATAIENETEEGAEEMAATEETAEEATEEMVAAENETAEEIVENETAEERPTYIEQTLF
ncbi:MAG: MerR family transcriptional regulator [Alistipes sp.]|jgi:DNA-binding transcriptional MerR regulator|nr:MerR family transcriptional regulator [Alistipes sp.]